MHGQLPILVKRSLLFAQLLICCLLPTGQLYAGTDSTVVNQIPDSILQQITVCGSTGDYFRSFARNHTSPFPQGYVAPGNFPSYAIQTCGVFKIYYEDLITTNPQVGFADPTLGATRRNTFCLVLTALQQTLDFSHVNPNDPIRIDVPPSYGTPGNPAPVGTTFFARASPTYSLTPGIVYGYVHDYVVSSTDPAGSNEYHAQMQVNFDETYSYSPFTGYSPVPILWHNDGSTNINTCELDLFTTLYHEMTHALGWISLLQYSGTYPNVYANIPSGQYSAIDNTIYAGNSVYPASTLVKLISGGVINPSAPPVTRNYWINNNVAPNNFPVTSSGNTGTFISHMDDDIRSYTDRQRISPGDRLEYVMGPFGIHGNMRRQYTDPELGVLTGTLGYSYNPTFFTANSQNLLNTPPYSSKMVTLYNSVPPLGDADECIIADYTLVNDIGSSYTYYFASDATLSDLDGDAIYGMPETIINYRGCGNSTGTNSGNNHDQITPIYNGSNQMIGFTYTPRANFYGRAQFGLNIWDGKEKGSFVLYTVDVQKGTNVSCPAGTNMVLNGDFENGSEVKMLGANETNLNTSVDESNLHEGKFMTGAHLDDSHPFNEYTNSWDPFGGGTAIYNSNIVCSQATYITENAGNNWNSFPTAAYLNPGVYPAATTNNGGNRYQILMPYSASFYLLGDDAKQCHYYTLAFDAYAPNTGSTALPIVAGFTNTSVVNCANTNFNNCYYTPLTFQIPQTLPGYPSTFFPLWKTYLVSFWYCASNSSNMLYFHPDGGIGNYGQTLLIDNLKLIDNTAGAPPLTVTIAQTQLVACSTVMLTGNVANQACSLSYSWSYNGQVISTAQSITVPISSAGIYTLTVNDGCRTASTTANVLGYTISPTISAAPTSCIPTTLTVSPSGTGYSYVWSGAGSGTSNPYNVNTAGTYTVTVTNSSGCVASQHINVMPANFCCSSVTSIPSTIILSSSITTPNGNELPATATALLNYFGNPVGNIINTNADIFIDGTFVIDHNISFSGCRNIVYGANAADISSAKIVVAPNISLSMVRCTIKAACDYMWSGIMETTSTSSITLSADTLEDMRDGVQISNDAQFNGQGTYFINDKYGLVFTNCTYSSYTPIITGNTFQTTSTLLIPPFPGNKETAGVYTTNVRSLLIGDNVTQYGGNTFDNVMTGIHINVTPTASAGTYNINIFDNQFQNITGALWGLETGQGLLTNLYTDSFGNAIYAYNKSTATNVFSTVHVGYVTGNTSNIINCNKGITSYATGLNVSNTTIKNVTWGIEMAATENESYSLMSNNLQNVYKGIEMNATPISATISLDTINSASNSWGYFNSGLLVNPIGISLVSYVNTAANSVVMSYNNITMNALGGTGINLQNTGKGVSILKNSVFLTTTSPGSGSGLSNPTLDGIALNNSLQTSMQGNRVKGTTATYNTPRTGVAAISMDNSQKLVLQCNHDTATKYGFQVVGNCATGSGSVEGNDFYQHVYGMLFQHLGNEGTLGTIGMPTVDNANKFYGTGYSGGFKVYRQSTCTIPGTDYIYTMTTLTSAESGPSLPITGYLCHYIVNANNLSHITYNCPSSLVYAAGPGGMVESMSDALSVAQGTATYPEYQDGTAYMNSLSLYRDVANDSAVRDSSTVLDSFYNASQTTSVGQVNNMDSTLGMRADSTTNQDSTTYSSWLQQAHTMNVAMVGPEDQTANEKLIDSLYLLYTEYGLDTLNNSTDSAIIASLALQCPLAGGPGVYKARMLYTYFASTQTYDDLDVCNAAGIYRLQEDSELQHALPTITDDDGSFRVYPNPTTGMLNISYTLMDNDHGVVEIMDLYGRIVTTISLDNNRKTASAEMYRYASGIYYYRYIVNGAQQQTGKIVLVK